VGWKHFKGNKQVLRKELIMRQIRACGSLAACNYDWFRVELIQLIEENLPEEQQQQARTDLFSLVDQLKKGNGLRELLNSENPVGEVRCFGNREDLQKAVLVSMLCLCLALAARRILGAFRGILNKNRELTSPEENLLSLLSGNDFLCFLDQLARFRSETWSKLSLSSEAFKVLVAYGRKAQFTPGVVGNLTRMEKALRHLERIGCVDLPVLPKSGRRYPVSANVSLSSREAAVSGASRRKYSGIQEHAR
jgi:hypothetical protein